MEKQKIKVLVKEPYKEPYVKEIKDELEDMQEIVGGLIDCIDFPKTRDVTLYVNDEGKLDKLQGNFWLPEYEDCVVGTCFVAGFDEETGESVSLTDKQIKECDNYMRAFAIPDGFDLYGDFYYLCEYMKKQYKAFNREAEMW